MKPSKKRVVFTSRIADHLIELGEEFLFTRPDLKKPDEVVFIFKDSETFNRNMSAAQDACK